MLFFICIILIFSGIQEIDERAVNVKTFVIIENHMNMGGLYHRLPAADYRLPITDFLFTNTTPCNRSSVRGGKQSNQLFLQGFCYGFSLGVNVKLLIYFLNMCSNGINADGKFSGNKFIAVPVR